jgi:hypothetical protein
LFKIKEVLLGERPYFFTVSHMSEAVQTQMENGKKIWNCNGKHIIEICIGL